MNYLWSHSREYDYIVIRYNQLLGTVEISFHSKIYLTIMIMEHPPNPREVSSPPSFTIISRLGITINGEHQLCWARSIVSIQSLDEYEGTRKPKRQGDELILGALERRSRLLHVMPAEHTVAKNGNAFSSTIDSATIRNKIPPHLPEKRALSLGRLRSINNCYVA